MWCRAPSCAARWTRCSTGCGSGSPRSSTEGQRRGELAAALDPAATAATVAAVVQGGYVLARAADDTAPFDAAVQGVLALLAAQVPAAG